MANGGMIQLVAYGTQDLYLTAKPQVTFWKSVHKRHTLFAVESTKQEINGDPDFGRRFSCTVAKNGDLLYKTMVEVVLPDLNSLYKQDAGAFSDVDYKFVYVNDIGLNLFKSIDLDIGGQKIERHTPEWCDSWLNLTVPDAKKNGLKAMIGHYDTWSPKDSTTSMDGSLTDNRARTLYIPLQFFFSRHQGLAIPLVALSFHDVKIHFEMQQLYSLVEMAYVNSDSLVPEETKVITLRHFQDKVRVPSFKVYTDMVFLDSIERNYFSSNKHEYLIEQVQFLGEESINDSKYDGDYLKVAIPFVNPVKELVWVFTDDSVTKDPLQYVDIMDSLRITMNGNDRFSERAGSFFRLVQPWNHHTSIPDKPIYVYSFANTPEEWQPSGTCNFSKIDSSFMYMKLNKKSGFTGKLLVFALSYNILKIMDGMAGLSYHN